MSRHLARRREPFLLGAKAFSSRSWEHAKNPNPEGDESAYMPASFLAVAFSAAC
jgi:hypothetical protein